MVAVLGCYFAIAAVMLSNGITELAAYVPLFGAAVVLMVVVLVAGHIVAAVVTRPEPSDERDRLIGWRAESNSSWILGVGVLMAVAGLTMSIERVWVAHVLLGSMFASEVAKYLFQVVYYRRGM